MVVLYVDEVVAGRFQGIYPEKDPRNGDGGERPSHLEDFAGGR